MAIADHEQIVARMRQEEEVLRQSLEDAKGEILLLENNLHKQVEQAAAEKAKQKRMEQQSVGVIGKLEHNKSRIGELEARVQEAETKAGEEREMKLEENRRLMGIIEEYKHGLQSAEEAIVAIADDAEAERLRFEERMRESIDRLVG